MSDTDQKLFGKMNVDEKTAFLNTFLKPYDLAVLVSSGHEENPTNGIYLYPGWWIVRPKTRNFFKFIRNLFEGILGEIMPDAKQVNIHKGAAARQAFYELKEELRKNHMFHMYIDYG